MTNNPNDVTIDGRFATDAEAEELRKFVKENYHDEREHQKAIRHITFEYAQRKARENEHLKW